MVNLTDKISLDFLSWTKM